MECVDYGKKGGDWWVEGIGEWALTEDSISQETQKNKNTLFVGRMLGSAVPTMGNCYMKLLKTDYTTLKKMFYGKVFHNTR